MAKIGLVLAVLTVVAALAAAVIAAFVIDRDDREALGCQTRLTGTEQVFDTEDHGSCGAARRVGAQL